MTQPYESLGIIERNIFSGPETVDLTVVVPDGNGVYGYEKAHPRPELLAPRDEDVGGSFSSWGVKDEVIDMLVGLSGMASTEHRRFTDYAVQIIDAPAGLERELGYLRKIVIAKSFSMRFLFKQLVTDDKDTPEQPIDVAELVKAFVKDEQGKYGTMFGNKNIAGKFGGDGHYSQESLGFGFAVENSYYGVISVWSRGWLCTK